MPAFISLNTPAILGGTVQTRSGTEVVETVDEGFDEKERSWVLTLVVL